MEWIRAVTEETFHQHVERCELPVLVHFSAPWCGPCRVVTPSLEAIARAYAGRVRVVSVNTDRARALMARYQVQNIPTIMVLLEGAVVESAVGVRPQEEYERQLQRALELQDPA